MHRKWWRTFVSKFCNHVKSDDSKCDKIFDEVITPFCNHVKSDDFKWSKRLHGVSK